MKKIIVKVLLTILLMQSSKCSWSEQTLSKLSLEEKIAQLFIIGARNNDFINHNFETIQNTVINLNENEHAFSKANVEFLIKKYKVGGVHFIQYGTIESSFKSINYFQSISEIPLLITQDFEWGLSMRLTDALRFPRNMTLGAIQNNDLIYKLGLEIGRQCNLLGVHINLAPVVDININPENPVIADRSFGQNKENVALKAFYFMKGLQDAGIIACAKHFCGHGDTNIDSHLDLPIINHSLDRIQNIELYPFKKMINEGVKSIMSAHIHVPSIDSRNNRSITLSYKAMTDLLQKELNFSGLIITDALNMKGITKYSQTGQIELEAFLAGNDILLMSQDVPKAIKLIKDAIDKGEINVEELDKRVLKILKIKENLGLSKKKYNNLNYNEFFLSQAKTLKKELYESAITLIKNEDKIISKPCVLFNKKKCLITISDKTQTYKTFSHELLSYSDFDLFFINKTDTNEFNNFLNLSSKYEITIIGLFDLNKFKKENYGVCQETLSFLNKLNEKKIKIILTIFGNPYSLNQFNNFKNIIMAYENEQDCQITCAKIIFGKLEANGKLPISIN